MATISETRQVRDFTEVALQGYGDVTLEQSPDGAEGLVIEADEAIISRLSSQVVRGRLRLGFDMPWYEWLTFWFSWILMPNKAIRYHVRMKQVNGLAISGSGRIMADVMHTERCILKVSGSGKICIAALAAGFFATNISGSGDVELAGTARRHEIHISGSGTVKAAELQTQDCFVRISGSGRVFANAGQNLDVKISGSGSVRYSGQPKIQQKISGSGRVAALAAP
jgi:hypothetical protein